MNFIFEELFKKEGIFLVSSCWQISIFLFPPLFVADQFLFLRDFLQGFQVFEKYHRQPNFLPSPRFFPYISLRNQFSS